MKKIIGVMAVAMLLTGALIAPASADPDTCATFDGGSYEKFEGDSSDDWGSIQFTQDDGPLVLDVNPGYEVDLCLKKGSDNSPHGGAIHAPDNPYGEGQHNVEFPGAEGEGFSHYGLKFRVIPAVCPSDSDANAGEEIPEGETAESFCSVEEDEVEIAVDGAMVCAIDLDDEDDLGELLLSYWIDTESTEDVSLSVDGADLGVVALTGALQWPLDGEEIAESVELVATVEGESDSATVLADDDEIARCSTEVLDSPPLTVAPAEEPAEEPAEVDSVKVEKKTEVLAEAETLPETGVPALVLALLGLVAMGSGGALLRRRR